MASLTLRVWASGVNSALADRGLKLEVTNAVGMSDAVFVWQRAAAGGDDMFVSVAAPSDLNDIPENSPNILNEMPYYRTNTVEIWFRNDSDFMYYKDLLQLHVEKLVTQVNQLSEVTLQTEVTYPLGIT